MASKSGTLRVNIIGDSGPLEKTLSGVGGKLAKFGAAAAAAGAAVGAGLFKVGESFDQAFDTIRVGTGATGETLDALKEDFRSVARDVPANFGDVGTAVADLNTRLGLTGVPLQEMSEQFLNLSRITGEDLSGSIAAGTRVLGDFAIAADDQSGAMDTLFKAAQATGIGVTELAEKMTASGAPLRQLGFGFEESAALIGKFEKEGVNAEAILGGMKQSLGRMAKAGEAPIETFERLSEEIANAGSTGEANAIAVETFGTRAGPDLAAAIREGRFSLEDLMGSIEGSSETINKAAGDTESFGEKWQKVKNRVLLALEPVATRVFEGLGALMDRLGPVVDTVASAFKTFFAGFQSNGEALQGFASTARQSFATVTEAVGVVRDVVVAVFGAVRQWLEDNQATIDVWSQKLVKVFGQIQEVVASVMEAVTEIIKVAVNIISAFWERFGRHLVDFLARTVGRIIDVVSGAFQVLKGIFDLIKAVLTGQWGDAWDAIKNILAGAWRIIHTVLAAAWDAVKTIFGAGVAAISQVWSFLWDQAKQVLAAAWDKIVQVVKDRIAAAKGAFDGIVSFVRELPGKIASAASGMWDSIWAGFKDMINRVISGWNNLSFRIPAIDVPGPFNFEGATVSTPNLPMLAHGGMFEANSPTLAIVGDNRTQREIVSPVDTMRQTFRDVLTDMVAATQPAVRPQGQTAEVNFHFHGPVYAEKNSLRRMLQEALRDYERYNGRTALSS